MQRLAVLVDHIDGAGGNRGDFEVAFGASIFNQRPRRPCAGF
jgi:hypothetical protein